MDSQIGLFKYETSTFQIPYVLVDNQPWFKGKDIANTLGYIDTKRAIQHHVDDDDKSKMEELMGDNLSPMDYQAKTSIY